MRYPKRFHTDKPRMTETDFLVIGSGVAGLRAAIESSKAGRVTVITKGDVAESSTWKAQGGIAVALAEGDEPELHMEDTLNAGAGLCDRKAVKVLVEEGVSRVQEMISWGAKFDMENGRLSFTKEAAHNLRRIIHAMGDATGEEVHRTLMRKSKGIKNIRFMNHTFLLDLIIEGKECLGGLAINRDKIHIISSSASILASGGLGHLYKNTTNPQVATGDGFSIAYRAGCQLRDMEFIQFHPTTLYMPGKPCFLISESMRGEGGILRNSKGEAFMSDYHEMRDLAPRDVVSRAVFSQKWRTGNESVFLDMRHLGSRYLKKRFPHIYNTCKEYGLNIARDLIPVRPAAHFMIGGVKTNLYGETNIKRLFACGEVASVGVHGANRLASNSLLEGLVFGKRAGDTATKYTGDTISKEKVLKNITEKTSARKERNELGRAEFSKIRKSVKELMEKRAGITRCGESLREALKKLNKWDRTLKKRCKKIGEFEVRNMITVALLITKAALIRKESRGAHYRSDFPFTDDKNWKKHITLKKPEGNHQS